MALEYATTLFLVGIFIMAEVYRLRRGRVGVLVGVKDSGLPLLGLPATEYAVRLDDGTVVAATASCCTACMGRFELGDRVKVAKNRDGYVIDLPWVRGKGCGAGVSSNCGQEIP